MWPFKKQSKWIIVEQQTPTFYISVCLKDGTTSDYYECRLLGNSSFQESSLRFINFGTTNTIYRREIVSYTKKEDGGTYTSTREIQRKDYYRFLERNPGSWTIIEETT